jgi:histone H3/H4
MKIFSMRNLHQIFNIFSKILKKIGKKKISEKILEKIAIFLENFPTFEKSEKNAPPIFVQPTQVLTGF